MTYASTTDPLQGLLNARHSCRHYADEPLSSAQVNRLLTAAQGRTATGDRRMAPSAHALYPLSLYVIARRVTSRDSGIYSIDLSSGARWHLRGDIQPGALLSASLANDVWLEQAPAIVVITVDENRAIEAFVDQPPDGRRGLRYADFEAGAMTQNLYLCAAQQNLGGVIVMGFADRPMHRALDLPAEHTPIGLFCVGYPALETD